MDRAAIRLECLKLRNRLDLPPEVTVAAAKVLEDYVLSTEAEAAPAMEVVKATTKKKAGNPTSSQG